MSLAKGPGPAGWKEARGELRYHLLRAALERFQCDLVALSESQRSQVEGQARRTFDLESLVLSSCEAGEVVIPEERLTAAVEELRGRYPGPDAFEEDLARNGLDRDLLRRALRRELIFDAVMRRVGAYAPPLTEVEERLFYELHSERFSAPERRAARHILVTLNEDYAENRRHAALARITGIARDLGAAPGRFPELARRHSECPTAMQGGSLGLVSRGQLYATLDAALFGLDAGRISGVLESRLGFHLLLCERIEPARPVTFDQARARIRSALERRRVRDAQKDWIASLRRT